MNKFWAVTFWVFISMTAGFFILACVLLMPKLGFVAVGCLLVARLALALHE